MTVRLLLFGSPTVEYAGESFALPFERRNQLLAFLAMKRSWVGRAELAAMLWPEQETKLAYANLRKTLHRLQSLPWAGTLESQSGALRFGVASDVHGFESALREQRVADALALRRGELLAGFDDGQSEAWSSWLSFERDRLRLAWRDAALTYLAADIDSAEGIELSARLLETDPLDEAALRAHMNWLARGGQSARARQTYREFVTRLQQDLGLTPSAEMQALHDSVGSGSTPPRTIVAPPQTLDPDFVGRTVELRRIATLLAQDDCRLISVLGPGGVGKTRFAQRAMQQITPSFSDGAVFVPLEDISSSSELGGRLARELGIRLRGRDETLNQVVEFLREKHMLLVLDNYEQLASDASVLQKLLEAAPRLKVIVTSRVRLALSMEWLLPLEGLPWPDVEDQDRFEGFDAVRLFVQAARRVAPALIPSAEAASIIDICQRVGGVPLALQLAAAWTRVLSCAEIADELRHGTELLQAADATHPARHASIEAVFDHSWRLLSPVERKVLARLSVFRGGFTADAARAVATASLPVLGALADKSLLRKEGGRIFMHPLLHQLAALRLDDAERGEALRAHARYFNRLLAQLQLAVENGDRDALHQVETDFENCRSAWRWSLEHDLKSLTKTATSLEYFCDYRGQFEEGLRLLQAAVDSITDPSDNHFKSFLLAKVAHLQYRLDRYADAQQTAKQGLDAASASDNSDAKVKCLNVLGSCALQLAQLEDARHYYAQSLEAAAFASALPHREAVVLDHLALVEKGLAHYDEALRLSLQSLAKHRSIGDVAGEALCLNNLADLYMVMHQYEAAAEQLRAGLAICDAHGIVSTRGHILANLAEIAMKSDDLEAADDYSKRALEVSEAAENRALRCWCRLFLARLALRRADVSAARVQLASAVDLAISLGRPALHIASASCFAEVLGAQGDWKSARQVLIFASECRGIRVVDRDEILAQISRLPPSADAAFAWPQITLEELLNRIVAEADSGYAALTRQIHECGSISASAHA